jgi:hypothetical protein
MHEEQKNDDLSEIWSAAQHRRIEDLTGWVTSPLKGSAVPRPRLKPRFVLARGIRIAIIAFAAITSVSAVVHAKKSPHVALGATSPMPAVSVP